MGAKLSKTREEFEKTVPPFMLVDARRAVEMLRSNPQEVVTRPTTLATSMKKGVRYVLEKDNAFSYAYFVGNKMNCEELPELYFVYIPMSPHEQVDDSALGESQYAAIVSSTLHDLERGVNFMVYKDPAPVSSALPALPDPLQAAAGRRRVRVRKTRRSRRGRKIQTRRR